MFIVQLEIIDYIVQIKNESWLKKSKIKKKNL